MLFKKAGAKHFVHLLLRIGLYCIKSFIIYYLLLYPFYSQLSMSALPYFSYQKRAYCIYQESIKSPSPFMINGLTMPLVILL